MYYYFLLSILCIGFLLAFLRYNLSNKKRVFMGDTGSMIVGFILAGVAGQGSSLRPASARLDAEEALVALGYKPAEAAQLIERVGDDDADTDTLIRRCCHPCCGHRDRSAAS